MTNIKYFIAIIILFLIIGFNFAQAIADDILEQEEAIQETVDADGATQMTISEKGFNNQLFVEAINGPLRGYVKSATVKIYDGYAEITSIVQKPITAKFFVRVSVSAKNGNLYPKFLKMRYGFMPIPVFLMNFFVGKLIGQSSQNFQSVGVKTSGIEWQAVDFKEGKVIVKFKETNN